MVAAASAVCVALVLAVCGAAFAAENAPFPTGFDGQPIAKMSVPAAKVYAETDELMRQMGDHVGEEMMKRLLPVVRAEPHSLLIGRLVVASARIAHGPDGPRRVDELIKAADQAPGDALANFIAGVAAHYRGHGHGTTREAKSADYKRTIRLLRRAEKELGHAPRLWIYLAVSYYRTGDQAGAEDAIRRAENAEKGEDADVYYCSAEVYHQKDPPRALADIDRYLAIMARNHAKGAYTAPHKEAAVVRMKAHLKAVIAGQATPLGLELFDPVVVASSVPRGWGKWLLAAVLALFPLMLVVSFKRARRSTGA